MAGGKSPAPYCSYSNPEDVEDGTLCRAPSPLPGSLGFTVTQPASRAATVVSPALKITLELPFSIAPQMTWDAFQRLAYDKLNAGLQQQANELLKRGSITYPEMEKLVNARNASVLQVRNRLTSFGELYSEILKPGASLKTAEQLLTEKGSIEAVLESVGKTRQVVDRNRVAAGGSCRNRPGDFDCHRRHRSGTTSGPGPRRIPADRRIGRRTRRRFRRHVARLRNRSDISQLVAGRALRRRRSNRRRLLDRRPHRWTWTRLRRTHGG